MAHAHSRQCLLSLWKEAKGKKMRRGLLPMLAVAISKGWRELSSSMWRNILQTSILRASVSPATWSCRDLTKLPRRGLHMNTLWRYMSGYHMTLRSAESVHKLVVQLLYTFLHNILRHWTDHRGQRSTKGI